MLRLRADLGAAGDVRVERSHQVHDLPEVSVQVTQHDVWRVRCGCGREHVGTLPAGVPATPSSYGPGLKTLVIYLIVYQHVPVERCVQLVADLTGGTAPSAGFVHGMLARCAAALAEVVTLIKTAITLAAVAGFDETTIRCGPAGQKKYVLSGSTETAVAYHLGAGTWARSPRSGSFPHSPGSRCTTGTPAISTRAGRAWPGTKLAWLTWFATLRMPPGPGRMRSGPPRRSALCAG